MLSASPNDILDLSATKQHLPITLTLNDVDNGEYIMITKKMREMHEGLLKKWTQISSKEYILPNWKEYLASVCIPTVSLTALLVESGSIRISQTLEPYEIQMILLSPKEA